MEFLKALSSGGPAGGLGGINLKSAKAEAGELKRLGACPSVSLGKAGLTPSFLESLDGMLWDNEYVVIRDAAEKKKEAKEVAAKVKEEMVGVEVVQLVGHTIMLCRRLGQGRQGDVDGDGDGET